MNIFHQIKNIFYSDIFVKFFTFWEKNIISKKMIEKMNKGKNEEKKNNATNCSIVKIVGYLSFVYIYHTTMISLACIVYGDSMCCVCACVCMCACVYINVRIHTSVYIKTSVTVEYIWKILLCTFEYSL